jgi:hypothetical protein
LSVDLAPEILIVAPFPNTSIQGSRESSRVCSTLMANFEVEYGFVVKAVEPTPLYSLIRSVLYRMLIMPQNPEITAEPVC